MTAVFQAQDLSKQYRKKVVLDHLNFQVPEGSVFGLIGENGAGKTTTIKIMMNILQPSAGSAQVLGVDSRQLLPKHFTTIGYVSENQEMPGWMTVDYLLQYLKPFYPTWDDARAAALVRQFNLPRDRKISQLSRGMWMKAALASSLAYHPRLLVLDEPFSGLDPLVRDELISELVESSMNTTILISSHDLAEIENFASHIGYLNNGRLQFADEMTTLSARFQEIELTLDHSVSLGDAVKWPATWLQATSTGKLLRFVDSQFDPESTPQHVHSLIPGVQQFSVKPMSLRQIFLSLARTASKAS